MSQITTLFSRKKSFAIPLPLMTPRTHIKLYEGIVYVALGPEPTCKVHYLSLGPEFGVIWNIILQSRLLIFIYVYVPTLFPGTNLFLTYFWS